MFVAGPPVVNRLSPKQFDKQELGGWEIQLRAGAIDEAVLGARIEVPTVSGRVESAVGSYGFGEGRLSTGVNSGPWSVSMFSNVVTGLPWWINLGGRNGL